MINPTTSNTTAVTTADGLDTTLSPIISTTELVESDVKSSARFDWDEQQKQLILGSFFWGYVLTELPGGRLAELIGGHRVFGHSMFWASIITLVTPITAHMGYTAMVILRAVLGFMLGGNY